MVFEAALKDVAIFQMFVFFSKHIAVKNLF